MGACHFRFGIVLAFVLPLQTLGNETATAPPQQKANVLMICIDDLNDWVGCLGGHPDAKTPNIDALAQRGRLFTNAHCVVPVCSPSRVSVMSGLRPTTHGSYELGPSYQSIPRLKDVPCLQQYFKDQGYLTIAGGKVLHHGFMGRLAKAIDVQLEGRRGGPRPKKQMNWPVPVWDWGPFPEKDEQMYDDQLARQAAKALGKAYDKPFFLSVGFFRPHVPMFVPPKWFDQFNPEKLTLPKAPLEDMKDVPPNFQNIKQIAPTHAEVLKAGKWRSLVQAYLANTTFVDACVGKVMEGLDKGPNKKKTVVVLWSDHGFHLGEKQHWAKRTLWEESTRVPLIVAGPGIEPGKPCREAVSLLDVYPTLVELCALPKNKRLEGLSLVPQLRDPAAARTVPAITSSYFGNHAVRSRHWRYVRYGDGAEELYDHRSDPDEHVNLAKDSRHRDTKAGLARWLPKKAAPEVKRQKRR